MSYGVTPYLVPWHRLQSLFGSKDQALLDRVLATNVGRLAELETLHEEDPVPYLHDILQGRTPAPPYVPNGAEVQCNKGGGDRSSLGGSPEGVVRQDGREYLTTDNRSIRPFGSCSRLRGKPCCIRVGDSSWFPYASAEGKKLLLQSSEIACAIGGTIGIATNGAPPAAEKSGALYALAFEMLCQETGLRLNNRAWYPTGCWHELADILPDDLPFHLPRPVDFPAYAVVHPDNLTRVAGELKRVPNVSQDAERQFLEWVAEGKATGSALVLFYY